MKRLLPLAASVLVVGCATTGRAPAAPSWLVGTWLAATEGTEFPDGCESDAPIRYDANGTYAFEEERGSWRLDGDRLVERPSHGATAGIGRPHASRIERIAPDRFRKTFQGGESLTFRRCPG